ncbi:hypothetical protein [Polymorphobacter fuscus]|uniref:DUF3300 domain-containing protein n=1 Tax=Sandarakinorhabdus fusca TaxID=1439888 RepID=A0A7C9KYJ9_9SPHN|nr:hypothetical protein [Polymorphobacter fuscus]KAB7644053.1 hypothetical protein F9290_14315 [Polymorphobacter fuscus]MQT18426.1 hypothetical protein [Polymorphobacter fuscus]NJC08454.1 hypothetical protein [Polymorphobacter fuscus]
MIRFLALATVLCAAGSALAAEPVTGPPAPQVYGLTPEQKAAVLETASRRPDADDPALLPGLPDRRPHGEVGMMVGTGGARGIYGVVGVPLSDNASATFAFSNSRLPGYYGYGPYGGGNVLAQRNMSMGLGMGMGLGSTFGSSLGRQPAW